MISFYIAFVIIVIIIFIKLSFYIKYYKYNYSYTTANNNNKIKINIYIIFGTRPEAIKLYPLIRELNKNLDYFNYKIICTYQQQEMVTQILNEFNIYPNISLKVMEKNQPLSLLSSKLFLQLESVFSKNIPDITVVQGDTTTALIAALCSYYHKVPVAHIESGLRTRNIYLPFPEELNRQTISNIAKFNFCPTQLSANNLLYEKKDYSTIYVVGNTVVDTLKYDQNIIKKNRNLYYIYDIINHVKKNYLFNHIILLTIHRRENYGYPFIKIIKSVIDILKYNEEVVIIYPLHLNPNVMISLKQAIPSILLDRILHNRNIEDGNYYYLNRFIVIQPLGYFSLIYIIKKSYFIMTDSGGIQEEAVALQKPVLILRNTTERMEGVLSNSAKLVGTNNESIYYYFNLLIHNSKFYASMINNPNIYGNGTAAKQIIAILKEFKNKKTKKTHYSSVVIVLTVWKRNNLLMQLNLINSQSILKWMKVSIIIYHNNNYVNVSRDISEWENINNISLTVIKTEYDTGYYGRFLAPLTYFYRNSYFIVCDDDIIFGSLYFENMIRVVDEGNLATRNGRFIDCKGREIVTDKFIKGYYTWENDLQYDFGGHIWAGKLKWLKLVWQHPPPSLENCEDAWISIVLKKFYNINTKIPRCPFNHSIPYKPTMCACSDLTAKLHLLANIGNKTIHDISRSKTLKLLKDYYNFKGIMEVNKAVYINVKNSKVLRNNSIYDIEKDVMGSRCLYFI